jgi:hypothetical protein
MKQSILLLAFGMAIIFLNGCTETSAVTTQITTEENIETCEYQFVEEYGETIQIQSIDIPYSDVLTNASNFISPCKQGNQSQLIINDSSLKTHQIFLEFDAIYPVEFFDFTNYEGTLANAIEMLSIEVSINGINFTRIYNDYEVFSGGNRIDMNNRMVKAVKLVIDDDNTGSLGIQDIQFKLGEGFIIREETEFTSQFLRHSGWTGSDGIFSFDLENGSDMIGSNPDTIGFIFSDTFIGDVRTDNFLRENFSMINNSFGYLNQTTDSFTFDWDASGPIPESVLLPNEYIGSRARNLLDNDGLSVSYRPTGLLTNINEGTMWLSEDLSSEIIIDLKDSYGVGYIYIWNYNANPDYGVQEFELYTSLDGANYNYLSTYQMNRASGSDREHFTLDIAFDSNITRYLKIKVKETYSQDFVGLGKIMLFSVEGTPLFGEVTASSEVTELTTNETTSRLWLQDGLVIDNKIYVFPILVKDFSTYFMVHSVGLIEMDIISNRFDYEHARYINTPLMTKTLDGGTIYFGAGVMDNRTIDGFIYIYGYKDLSGRHLVVARVTEEGFLNFNEWTYFNGENWSNDINDCEGLLTGVSAELSVTHINTGVFAGKYMLVAMENTTSGNVVFSISDTPYGAFREFTLIYNTTENEYLNGAFTYNAKLHPNLSNDGTLIISYNVNTTNINSLRNANIYYPRFISMTEIKKDEEGS